MLLERLRAITGRRFWKDDARLVALARANHGRLATFDRRLRRLLARDQGDPSFLLIRATS